MARQGDLSSVRVDVVYDIPVKLQSSEPVQARGTGDR